MTAHLTDAMAPYPDADFREPSLLTRAYILEKYGLRLNADALAELLGVSKATLYNQISAGSCPIPTYLDGGKRFADYRDVAAYFDRARLRAA